MQALHTHSMFSQAPAVVGFQGIATHSTCGHRSSLKSPGPRQSGSTPDSTTRNTCQNPSGKSCETIRWEGQRQGSEAAQIEVTPAQLFQSSRAPRRSTRGSSAGARNASCWLSSAVTRSAGHSAAAATAAADRGSAAGDGPPSPGRPSRQRSRSGRTESISRLTVWCNTVAKRRSISTCTGKIHALIFLQRLEKIFTLDKELAAKKELLITPPGQPYTWKIGYHGAC
jgi:hypothetical protein